MTCSCPWIPVSPIAGTGTEASPGYSSSDLHVLLCHTFGSSPKRPIISLLHAQNALPSIPHPWRQELPPSVCKVIQGEPPRQLELISPLWQSIQQVGLAGTNQVTGFLCLTLLPYLFVFMEISLKTT